MPSILSKARRWLAVHWGMNAFKPIQGTEQVLVCKDCGCKSTDDLRGTDAFTNVFRGGGCQRVCKVCADLHKHGQAGLMAVLLRDTKAANARKPKLEFLPQPAGALLVVPCCPVERPSYRAPSVECLYVGEDQ
jgi:hypothetical protein